MKKIFLTLTALAAINLQSMDTSSLGNKETALAITAGLAGLYATGSVLCYAADIDICKNGKTMLMPFFAPFVAAGTAIGSAYLMQGATGLSSEASLALGTGLTSALIAKGLADRISSKIKLTRTSHGITSALLGAGIAGSTKLGLVTAQNSNLTTGIALAAGLAAAYGYYTHKPNQLAGDLNRRTFDLQNQPLTTNIDHNRKNMIIDASGDTYYPYTKAIQKVEDHLSKALNLRAELERIQNYPGIKQSLTIPQEFLGCPSDHILATGKMLERLEEPKELLT